MKSRLVLFFSGVLFVFYMVSTLYLKENTAKAIQRVGVTPTSDNYLPVILRQLLPTFTPTPTPTNTPPPVYTLQNGNFEQGPNVGWQEFSSNGWALILNANDLPMNPHGGSWAAWLGGDHDEISVIWQQVSVPGNNPNLRFWYWIASEDICGYDFGGVIINSSVVDVFDLCDNQDTGGWIQRTVNLGAYSGQVVNLEIRAETDGSLVSNLFVDDVTLGDSLIANIQEHYNLQEVNVVVDKKTSLQDPQRIRPSNVLSRVWAPIGSK